MPWKAVIDLLPCPFCDDQPVLRSGADCTSVECESDTCPAHPGVWCAEDGHRETAIRWWNGTRQQAQEPPR
jgi:hypothetical protein